MRISDWSSDVCSSDLLLNVSMAVSIGAGAVAVFRIAMHHLENEWQSVVLSLAFLTTYAGQWMIQETFHPEVMAITPLLFAYLAALEGRWRPFSAWPLPALDRTGVGSG